MIFGAIGATALTIGLGVGATLAAGDPIPPTPTEPTTQPTTMTDAANGGHMLDADDMTSMMGGRGMTDMMAGSGITDMMDAGGMDAMHAAMHDSLLGSVSADILASCDAAHTSAPANINVKAGETVRRRFDNAGLAVHEAVIGDLPFQEEHAEEMAASGSGHDGDAAHEVDADEAEPLVVAVGDTGDLVYTAETPARSSSAATSQAIGMRV